MKKLLLVIVTSLICVPLMSCGNSGDTATIYVLASQKNASRFSDDLAAIAKRLGLTPNQGHSTDDHGRTYWVTEAKGQWMRLWSTNMPLSGQENVASCGRYPEGHPGQYIVTLNRSFPLIAHDKPRALLQVISTELKASGYEVRQSPVECSPLSKAQSDS